MAPGAGMGPSAGLAPRCDGEPTGATGRTGKTCGKDGRPHEA